MDLIFDSPRPIFVMFSHWHFFHFNTTLFLNFLFDFLNEMMKFLAILFCRDSYHWIQKRRPGLRLKNFTIEGALRITYSLQKTNLTISSSKQSFEEESFSSIIDDENSETKTYWRHPHGLLALFDILKTKP